eukprot:1662315-Prymnesium_polylepis.1
MWREAAASQRARGALELVELQRAVAVGVNLLEHLARARLALLVLPLEQAQQDALLLDLPLQLGRALAQALEVLGLRRHELRRRAVVRRHPDARERLDRPQPLRQAVELRRERRRQRRQLARRREAKLGDCERRAGGRT